MSTFFIFIYNIAPSVEVGVDVVVGVILFVVEVVLSVVIVVVGAVFEIVDGIASAVVVDVDVVGGVTVNRSIVVEVFVVVSVPLD